MQYTFLTLPLLLAGLCAPTWAQHEGAVRIGDQRRQEVRHEVRDAVEAHKAVRREEARHEEAVAGRRLTAEERAELREQVRRQWLASSAAAHPAELQPAERVVPSPGSTPFADAGQAPSRTLVPAARSQRP